MVHLSPLEHSAWSTKTLSCFYLYSTSPYDPCHCFSSTATSTGTDSYCESIWIGGKSKRKEPKDKTPQAPPSPKAPKSSPLCTLCKVVGQATNNCPKLPHLKPLIHETFPESNIPEVQVTFRGPAKKLIMLHTNHLYSLCDHCGHYSHYFPPLDEFCDFLEVLPEYKAAHHGSHTSLPMGSISTSKPKQGDFGPTIVIPPPMLR